MMQKRKQSHRRATPAGKNASSRNARPSFAGVELYFDNLDAAKEFYRDRLGLNLQEEQPGHHAQFDTGSGFICLERKGVENYPSADKAVLFFEVPDLDAVLAHLGSERIVHREHNGHGQPAWAVLHDPEGHNILLLERKPDAQESAGSRKRQTVKAAQP